MLIDTHAHLTDESFGGDLEEVLDRAARGGVGRIIDVGDALASSLRCLENARRYRCVRAAVGIHPNNAGSAADDDANGIAALAGEPGVVGIGETGLDFYRDRAPRARQERLFAEFLRLAAKAALPVIMHCRDAYGRLISMLREAGVARPGGVLHCFSGSVSDAEALVEMGYFISVGGPLTYPGNARLREAVRRIPRERVVVETDCPYLPPQEKRGMRNEPAFVSLVVAALARLWGTTRAEAAEVTTANAMRLFAKVAEDGE